MDRRGCGRLLFHVAPDDDPLAVQCAVTAVSVGLGLFCYRLMLAMPVMEADTRRPGA